MRQGKHITYRLACGDYVFMWKMPQKILVKPGPYNPEDETEYRDWISCRTKRKAFALSKNNPGHVIVLRQKRGGVNKSLSNMHFGTIWTRKTSKDYCKDRAVKRK